MFPQNTLTFHLEKFVLLSCTFKDMFFNQIAHIMKKVVGMFFIVLIFSSCKENKKKDLNNANDQNIGQNMDTTAENTFTQDTTTATLDTTTLLSGIFIRSDDGKEGGNCQCNCVDINFSQQTILCIDEKSGLSIEASFEKASDGSLNIFYVRPQNKEGIVGGKIPWDKFDTGVPIATIDYSSGDTFKLDWKGFTIDGEIAVDYAIYGKKNLEGNYVKK